MIRRGTLNPDFDVALGENLKYQRLLRRMSRARLAESVGGVHRNTLMRWETGEAAMPLCMVLRVADILHCNHMTLLPDKRLTWGTALDRTWAPMALADLPPKKPVQFERDPERTLEERRFG